MENKLYENHNLENIIYQLNEIIKITRITSKSDVKQYLEMLLDSDEKILVYESMDGERSVQSIQELTKVNVRYISEWGQEWERSGIVENLNLKGRRKKIFDLRFYDITRK